MRRAAMSAPKIDKVLAEIAALGYGTAEYHEAMWMLLSVMARRQAIIAESIRTNQRRRDRAAATRERRRQAAEQRLCTDPECSIEPEHGPHNFVAGDPFATGKPL
jgi:hypothetical protein